MNKFDKWLEENVPEAGGCLLAMDDTYSDNVKYYLVERKHSATGHSMFIVNGYFSWDFEFAFNDNWKIIYKKVI